jgi:dihydroxy-acid dehydratase
VQDGDSIEINLEARRIALLVPEDELARRKAAWSWVPDNAGVPPFLRLFRKNAGSLANGAIWE